MNTEIKMSARDFKRINNDIHKLLTDGIVEPTVINDVDVYFDKLINDLRLQNIN